MSGLRERKRRKTIATIHHAAMELFAERGYQAVTITEIAERADVGRATVFAYFPAKEDLVLGDSEAAIASLRDALASAAGAPVVDVVRGWLRTLVGWIEPDVVLQRRLAAEVPAVAAARSRVISDIEDVIAAALAGELTAASPLAPRLVARALGAALVEVEAEAARRYEAGADALSEAEVDALLDTAVAFVTGGLERLR